MKKLIITISITFIFLILFICIKNEFGRKLYKNSNYGMEVLISKGEIENLFLGSSMFRQGLDIFEIEKTIGEDSYILAFDGNQPAFEFLELSYLLKKGVKIKNLYIDMYPYTAAATPKLNDKRLLLQVDTKLKIDIWNTLITCKEGNLSLFWEMFITSNNETLLTFPVSNKFTEKLYYKGGNVQKNKGLSLEKISLLEIPKIQKTIIDDFQIQNLNNIINLCKKNDIKVKFIETPKWHAISEDKDYQEVMKQYIQCLQINNIQFFLSSETAKCLNCPKFHAIKFDSYKPDYFLDMVHMSSSGREYYCSQLFLHQEK